MTGMLGVAGER